MFPDNLLHLTLLCHEMTCFLNLMNQALLASSCSSAASSPHSGIIELRIVRTLLLIRIWLKGMLWLVSSSIHTSKTFLISEIKLFVSLSYHLSIHWNSIFNFLQELSLCVHNLTYWHKGPDFWPVK